MSLKITTLNIEHGRHLLEFFRFVEEEKPDILCLQEVFEVDVPSLATRTGYQGSFAPVANVQDMTHLPIDPRGLWGELLLYRQEQVQLVGQIEALYYVGFAGEIPIFTDPEHHNRVLQIGSFTQVQSGEKFVIGNTHFTWSAQGKTTDLQRQHFQQLSTILDRFPELVLAGDFNAPRGGELFSLFTQRFTDAVPLSVTTTLDGTFHYSGKQLDFVVDTLFYTPGYTIENVQVLCGISDHCAVVGEVKTMNAPPA